MDKQELKALLSKGLSGWQAGVLLFEDSWLVTRRAEDGFLSDKNIESLKARLGSQKDIETYNSLINIYRVAEYMAGQAKTELFMAALFVERLYGLSILYTREPAPTEEAKEIFQEVHDLQAAMARTAIRRLLARRQVLEELGNVLGLALEEELDLATELILQPSLRVYTGIRLGHKKQFKMSAVSLQKCKPRVSELEELRGWLVEPLGEDWWQRPPAAERKSVLTEAMREYWQKMSPHARSLEEAGLTEETFHEALAEAARRSQ